MISQQFHSAPSNERCVMIYTAISSTNQLNRRIGVCHTWATFLASVNTGNCLITNLSPHSETELFHTDRLHPVLGRIRSPSTSVSWHRGSHSQLYELTTQSFSAILVSPPQAARTSSATLLSPVLAEGMGHHRSTFNLHVCVRQSPTSLH